jgi:membrane protein YdbS with pleckstrin-like domain
MEQAIYCEWVPTGTFVRVTILVVASAIAVLLLILAVFLHPLGTAGLVGVGAAILTLLFILLLCLNFRGIRIQLSSERLAVDYGFFNHKRIRMEDIVSCNLVQASFRRFGGIGVRYGLDGSWAYTTSFGNAVEIVPKRGRTFVFSSNNPEQVCQIINTKTQALA